jgi:predicted DNA-binding transcriptional regulator AlpA
MSVRFLRRRDVLQRYSISNSTLYAWMGAGRFPSPIPLCGRVVVWSVAAPEAWEAELEASARGSGQAGSPIGRRA